MKTQYYIAQTVMTQQLQIEINVFFSLLVILNAT